MMGKFIDPRADWAFKRIFASDDTKDCLITFLNGLFKDELAIKDVKFQKNEQIIQRENERGIVFDVKCKTVEGRHIIVEMQKKEQEFFADRALYYTAKAITGQGINGRWNYHLYPVYTVCFMDFVAKNGVEPRFRTDMALCNLKTGKQEMERMRIVFLQLPLFTGKTEEECKDDIFKCWIYILKNMGEFEQMPFLDKYPVFRKLAAIGDLRKLTVEEQELYEEDIKNMRDLYSVHQFEMKQRRKELKKAREEARTEGRAEGRAEGKLEIAKRMLLARLSDDQIIAFTGLSQCQIDKLK